MPSAQRTHLAALDWLGRGVDMTSLTPFSIESVKKWVKAPRLIAIQNDPATHKVTINGEEYTIPRSVGASESPGTRTSDVTYRSGDEALRGFQGDPGASDRLALNTDISSYPLKASLPSDYQFGFFSLSSDFYSASLRSYLDFIDNELLREKISALPQPFSAEDPSAVAAYLAFFRELGTHVIDSTTYGGRCNISTWASNQYSEVNENWKRDVTAYLRGLNNRGEFDDSVLEEPQYHIFRAIAQSLCTLVGGDESLAESIAQGSFDYSELEKWLETTVSVPALTSLGVIPLWSLLRDSEDSQVREAADSIEAAFKMIVGGLEKKQHGVTTLVILECDSGVAEFGLLTPGAIVGVGGPLPTFDPTTQKVIGLSATKVRVGDTGEAQKDRLAAFYIINNGSPIDMSISRDAGNACVLINGAS
ncbi:hypothetical protein V5O48_011244 [Marasmius crinis-equi]|uniref:MACPF domain-containing protein n=1 Tax=Marasmius crinis-equi TaxID=585013 RepID=A0ABR3F684_9AGAR